MHDFFLNIGPQFLLRYTSGGGCGMIYYMENNQLNKAYMPTRDGGFKCCEPFDLSHNVISGKFALGAGE